MVSAGPSPRARPEAPSTSPRRPPLPRVGRQDDQPGDSVRETDRCRSGGRPMEVPLTPLEFARRTRRLHGRPGGGRRRRAAAHLRAVLRSLRPLVVRAAGARRGAGRPGGHHRAEHARAARVVLRRAADRRGAGADQLPADRRRLRLHHQPLRRARWSARHSDYLDARGRHPRPAAGRRALRGAGGQPARDGWLDYEAAVAAADARRSTGRRSTSGDLLSINYTSGTTARPKGVMITHRNAAMNMIGTLLHLPIGGGEPLPVDAADVPRQRLDLHLDGDGGGGTHVCLRKVDPAAVFELIRRRAGGLAVRRADGADRAGQRARRGARRGAVRGAGGDGRRAAGRGHDRADGGGVRLGGHAGLRADRDRAVHHRLRAAARARGAVAGRPGGRQGAPGRRADHLGRAAGGGRGRHARCPRTARRWARSSCAATW